MNDDLDIIAKYPDEPYEEEGFTSAAFKASFDQGAKLCKAALNALIRSLGWQSAAANIGFNPSASVNAENVQAAIESVQQQIADVALDSVPDGSIGTPKLADGSVTAPKIAAGSVTAEKLDTATREKYAVGDVFITTRGGNPNALLGYGTWLQIKDRFLLSSGDTRVVGNTGGEEKHTLTSDEMPRHTHRFYRQNWYSSDSLDSDPSNTIYSWPDDTRVAVRRCAGSDAEDAYSYVGGNLPHNNMPPYYVVNMWIRTA